MTYRGSHNFCSNSGHKWWENIQQKNGYHVILKYKVGEFGNTDWYSHVATSVHVCNDVIKVTFNCYFIYGSTLISSVHYYTLFTFIL